MEENKEQEGLEILQIVDGLDYIASALVNSDGTLNGTRATLDSKFDSLSEDVKSASFSRYNMFAIKVTDENRMRITSIASNLIGYSDVLIGSHAVAMKNYTLLDGIAMHTLSANNILEGVEEIAYTSRERVLASFDAIFSKKEEASLKIVFGSNKDDNDAYSDSIALVSGSFNHDTWELLSSIGRVSVLPSFFKRTDVKKRLGIAIILPSGLAMLETVISNIDGFSENVQEDFAEFLK